MNNVSYENDNYRKAKERGEVLRNIAVN